MGSDTIFMQTVSELSYIRGHISGVRREAGVAEY